MFSLSISRLFKYAFLTEGGALSYGIVPLAQSCSGGIERPTDLANYAHELLHFKKGVFDDTTPAQMEAAMKRYAGTYTQKGLALFFHGGLVSKSSGMTTAGKLLGPYSATDNAAGHGYASSYPYFFVWESGLFETLMQNLPQIVSETIFRQLNGIIALKVQSLLGSGPRPIATLMQRSIPSFGLDDTVSPATFPVVSQADIDDVQSQVENDPLIRSEQARIATGYVYPRDAMTTALESTGPRQVRASPITLLSPEIVGAIVGEQAHAQAVGSLTARGFISPINIGILALKAGNVLVRIMRRYAAGRNHGLHNTIVEEILRAYYIANVGWSIWAEMKQATADAFSGDPETCVGSKMVQELISFWESGKDEVENISRRAARVTLLGHSAGAIYIANFLKAIKSALSSKTYASDVKFDVIMMAPAMRYDSFAATIADCAVLIKNYRSFTMHDGLEEADVLLQFEDGPPAANALLAQIYTSSLLYFISGVLEDDDFDDSPLLGMERFLSRAGPFAAGKIASIDQVNDFVSGEASGVVYADTTSQIPPPAKGQQSSSHHHGGFPTDEKTLESTCFLLRTGNYT